MTSQKFEATPRVIKTLHQQNERYVIPAFQRPYRWQQPQVAQLIRDLLDFYSSADPDEYYSLGTIVCDIDENDATYQILDGQQRLTTIDLILNQLAQYQGAQNSHRLISAYRYLWKMETSNETPLPSCQSQMNTIKAEIDNHIGTDASKEAMVFYRKFEECILERVVVRRVVLPIAEDIDNEGPKMFEIINTRGQKLSELDQLKARFLQCFDDNHRKDRFVFTHLWNTFEPRLAQKQAWDISSVLNTKVSETDSYSSLPSEYSIEDILEKLPEQKIEQESDETEINYYQGMPPIDMLNVLVMANEILKYELGHKEDIRALTTRNIQDRFDWLFRSQTEPMQENVWRLMGIVSIIMQTAEQWGPYRNANDYTLMGDATPFNQLALSFMAANSYQPSGQYWLMLLSHLVLKNTINDELPFDVESFNKLKKPDFNALRQNALFCLTAWAIKTTANDFSKGSDSVFSTITKSVDDVNSLLHDTQKDVATQISNWRYDSGITQWNLYLLDWMLWCDCHKGNFKQLQELTNSFVCQNQDVNNALKSFDWDRFKQFAWQLRIVSRGAIEHWRARNNAEREGSKDAIELELHRLHGFGNLALIDASTNSSLGKLDPKDKSQEILNRSTNPTMKLLWLAVLTQNFEKFSGNDIGDITNFWTEYFKKYDFDCCL